MKALIGRMVRFKRTFFPHTMTLPRHSYQSSAPAWYTFARQYVR